MKFKAIAILPGIAILCVLSVCLALDEPAGGEVVTADQLFMRGEIEGTTDWIREWVPVISEEGGFSAEMPDVPMFESRVKDYAVGTIQENTYTLETPEADFTIEYTDLPTVVLIFGRGILYRLVKRNFLRECGGEEVDFKKFKLGRHRGKELIYDVPASKEAPARVGRAIFLLVDKRLYVVVATVLKDADDGDLMERFLDSFEIISGTRRRKVHKYKDLTMESLVEPAPDLESPPPIR